MFPLLCARSFLSSVPIKYHLPPDPGYNQPPSSLAARCEICFWAGGGGSDEDGGNGGDGDGGNGDGGSGGGDDIDGSVAAVTVAAVASVMIATAAAAVALAAMTTAVAAMTTSVVATYTMTPGPRRSQTPPRTTAVSAEAAAVAGNAHHAQNTVRKASAGAPKLRRGCTTYNHWIAGPCTSPVRGYCRCSSTNMAELLA